MMKFFIKPNDIEECKIICKWFDENHGSFTPGFYSNKLEMDTGYTNCYQKGNVYFSGCPKEAKQLTFSKFKELILGIKEPFLVNCL